MHEMVELSNLDLRPRGLSPSRRRSRSALGGVDRRAGHREAAFRRRHAAGPHSAQRLSALPLRQEAFDRLRPLRRAGRGRSRGDLGTDARLGRQVAEHLGTSPIHRRVGFGPRDERGRDRPDALAQQGVGEHAAEPVGRGTESGTGSILTRWVVWGYSGAMPRTARIAPGGMVFHVLNRGVARMQIFEKSADYQAFERRASAHSA